MYIEARRRRAHLAIVQQATEDRALHGFFDVGISEHDHQVFAAQFQREPRHVFHARHADAFAHRSGTGERHFAHQRMRGQHATHASTATGDNVEHAGRDARFKANSARRMAVSGVSIAGLMITVQPVASAGISFQAAISSGKFHGTIPTTTPTGYAW